jgi:hypothetical protein
LFSWSHGLPQDGLERGFDTRESFFGVVGFNHDRLIIDQAGLLGLCCFAHPYEHRVWTGDALDGRVPRRSEPASWAGRWPRRIHQARRYRQRHREAWPAIPGEDRRPRQVSAACVVLERRRARSTASISRRMCSAVAWTTGVFEPSRAGRSAASSSRRSKRPVTESFDRGMREMVDGISEFVCPDSRHSRQVRTSCCCSSSVTPPFGLPDTQRFDARAKRPELVLDCFLKCCRLLA